MCNVSFHMQASIKGLSAFRLSRALIRLGWAAGCRWADELAFSCTVLSSVYSYLPHTLYNVSIVLWRNIGYLSTTSVNLNRNQVTVLSDASIHSSVVLIIARRAALFRNGSTAQNEFDLLLLRCIAGVLLTIKNWRIEWIGQTSFI